MHRFVTIPLFVLGVAICVVAVSIQIYIYAAVFGNVLGAVLLLAITAFYGWARWFGEKMGDI